MSKKASQICILIVIIFGFSIISMADSSDVNSTSLNERYESNQEEQVNIEAFKLSQIYNENLKEEEINKLVHEDEKRKENVTYQREDVTILSNIKSYELESVLNHYNGAHTMSQLALAFVQAEEEYGVNAFFLAAIVALESGFATSRRAVEDNNLTGFEVYSDSSEGRLFSSHSESILYTAKHLSNNYLTEEGVYYNGISVDGVQVMYCPDEGQGKNWDGKVHDLAQGFLDTYKELCLSGKL